MNIREFRQKYPQYNDLSDEQLARSLHQKYAANMNYDEFASRFISGAGETSRPSSNPMDSIPGFLKPGYRTAFALSALSGVRDTLRGAGQLSRVVGEKIGLLEPGSVDEYTKKADKIRAAEHGLLSLFFPENPIAISIGREVGGAAPFLLAPYARVPGLIGRMGAEAAIGAGIGAAQYVPEGESRAKNTAIGAATGGVMPAVASGVGKAYELIKAPISGAIRTVGKFKKNILPKTSEAAIAKDLMVGIDADKALKTKEAAERLGINLTPAEASGSETVANAQRALGFSEKGQERMAEFLRGRKNKEQEIIRRFLYDVSPSAKDASGDIRDIAKSILSKNEMKRAESARPFYLASEKDTIPIKEMAKIYQEQPLIQHAYNDIIKNKAYQAELKGYDPNHIKFVDLVKRNMDDKINSLQKMGKNHEASLYIKANNQLIELADKYSPNYNTARSVYENWSSKIDKLKQSDIARIANLKDNNLQNVSRILFDRNETNLKTLGRLRDEIAKENPEAWRRIIRNEIERRLSHIEDGKSGSKFYDAILAKDADFNQFLVAAKGMPGVQRKLIDMRAVFKDLINTVRDKNLISKETTIKGPYSMVAEEAVRLFRSGYDSKAIEIITSNKWDKHLRKIMAVKNKPERNKQFLRLLESISSRSVSTAATKPGDSENG